MSGEGDNIRGEAGVTDFTLESIMAEYKGTAYINGDKKTPPELLNMQAERIIREVLGDEMVDSLRASAPGSAAGEPIETPDAVTDIYPEDMTASQADYAEETAQYNPAQKKTAQSKATEHYNEQFAAGHDYGHDGEEQYDTGQFVTSRFETLQYETGQFDSLLFEPVQDETAQDEIAQGSAPKKKNKQEPADQEPALQAPQQEAKQQEPARQEQNEDQATIFFNNYTQMHQDTQTSIGYEVQSAMENDSDSVQASDKASRKRYGKMARIPFVDGPEQIDESVLYEEPPLRQAAARFAKNCNSISLRSIPAAIITIFMVVLTFAFEAGMYIPFGIGRSQILASGTLLLAQLVVMILCIDILIRGVDKFTGGIPNAETLVLFSCAFSFLSGGYMLIGGSSSMLPYCAVSALSLSIAMIGEKYSLRAITETLKTAHGSTEPYGILGEYNGDIDKTVLKKAYNRTDGFYNNLIHPDVAETGYRYATPALLIGALVLPIVTMIFRGGGEYFLHIISAFFAAAAPFSALLAFSLPFIVVAKASRKSGAAIAGWGGSDDICFTDGACITDEDLFPHGTIKLNDSRVFEGEAPERVIRYTASIIIASGSGLTRVFTELLKTENLAEVKVENFECAEGGVRGFIRGDLVETGSAAFMNLIGVRIPDGSNLKNAVYTAINKKLVVVFPVDYTPINSVQGALISILKWRIKMYLAVRDFNVTPLMLSQKYKVSFEDMELIQARDSYAFSDAMSAKEGRMSAVLVREGLGPFAEVLTGGRLLKSAALVATVLSIISAAFGVLLVFYMCWSGAFLSVSPGNLMIFMLCMLASVLVVCGYVRCRR